MPRLSLGLVLRCLGAGGATALMMWLSDVSRQPLDGIPFATSIVLVMAVPESVFAQPRNVLGGHLLCAVCGIAATYLPPGLWQAPAAVAAGVLLMLLTRTMHPPAGINALLPVTHHFGWGFLFNPVAVGAVLLVLYATVFTRLVDRLAVAVGRRRP